MRPGAGALFPFGTGCLAFFALGLNGCVLAFRRQAEHLQKPEQQHDLGEDHRHTDRHRRVGQVADQRQRDRRDTGGAASSARPCAGAPPQTTPRRPGPAHHWSAAAPGTRCGQRKNVFIRAVMSAPAHWATAVCIMPGPTPSSLRQKGCAVQADQLMRQAVPR